MPTIPHPDRQRRRAAVASLAAGSAALFAALGFTVGSLGSLLLGVIGAACAIGGGWYAACNRGTGRVFGALVAVGGLAVTVGALEWAGTGLVGLTVAIGLGALSVACARYATGRRHDSVVAADLDPPAPPARRGVLIINRKSGGGKAESSDLVDECRARGIEPVVLKPGDELKAVAEQAVAGGADVLGMAGGDGSLGIVADVARENGIPFVVVPAGTRNHFALDLGLDRKDVVGALEAFSHGVVRMVDLAKVNDRIFVNNASLGLYAEIVASDSYRDAKLRTVIQALPDLMGPDAQSVDLRLTGLDSSPRAAGQIVLVSNNAYTVHSLDGLGSRARLDTGRLGVVSVTLNGPEDARRLLALQAAQELSRFGGWHEWQVERLSAEAGQPVPIAVDGESLTLDPPLRFEILPRALAVHLPRARSGAFPGGAQPGLGRSRRAVGAGPRARRVRRDF